MRISRRPFLLGAAAAAAFAGRAFADTPPELLGEWNGVLSVGARNLRLTLVLEPTAARIISVDQGRAVIRASRLAIDGVHVIVEFSGISGVFEGDLRDGRLVGIWRQGSEMPLNFSREALSGPPPIVAPPPSPLTQQSLAQMRATCGAPAMAAAAKSRDGRALALADGVRAIGREERVTTADKWHLGSITKSMTATLVARCVEAGLVSWDDTLASVLGAAVPHMRPEYRDANFLHLMSHRAGLQANIDMADFARFPREEPDARESRIAFARLALAQTPAAPKEESFLYSNSGFVLAGAMLEQKIGAPWEHLITERVFAPLGMASAGFGAPGTPGAFDQPCGHADAGEDGALQAFPPGAPVSDNPAVLGPAGRVHASFDDVLNYLAAHRDRTPLLSPESWDRLHTPLFGGDYALGWVRNGSSFWHNGSNTLWYAEVNFQTDTGAVAVAACNYARAGVAENFVSATLDSARMAVLSG